MARLKQVLDVAADMYIALQSSPCRCQMVGGPRWHLQAKTEVAKQCSRCAAIQSYELLKIGVRVPTRKETLSPPM